MQVYKCCSLEIPFKALGLAVFHRALTETSSRVLITEMITTKCLQERLFRLFRTRAQSCLVQYRSAESWNLCHYLLHHSLSIRVDLPKKKKKTSKINKCQFSRPGEKKIKNQHPDSGSPAFSVAHIPRNEDRPLSCGMDCSTMELRSEHLVRRRNTKILPPTNPGSVLFCPKKKAKDHVFSLIASLWWWRSLDHKVVVAHIFFLCSRTWAR